MATDLETARDVRQGYIDDSIVPGTVVLVDPDHALRAKHDKSNQDIVLVPTPSDDPEDPVCVLPRMLCMRSEANSYNSSTGAGEESCSP